MTTIYFVRHGEVHNPDKVFYARMPRFRLSERGREQAAAAAAYLAERPIAAIFSSPMLRARQTAQIIAEKHNNLPIKRSVLLNEIYTPYQGRLFAEMDAMKWRIYSDIDPEYEQPEDLVARIEKFTKRVLADYRGQEVVAVTHGDIVVHARLWAENSPLTDESRRAIQPYPITASINMLRFNDDSPLPDYTYHEPY